MHVERIPLIALGLGAALAAQDPPPAGGSQRRPELMLIPQAVVLPRGDRTLTIDGSLIDWPELPAINLADRRQLSGTAFGAWRGPADLGAMAFLIWDADALYIGLTVRDEWHRALDAGTLLLTEIPVADSVVLTFDPARDTRASGNDPGRADDREFWFGDETGREIILWDRLRGTARVLDGETARMVVLHDKEQGITTYEARLPWREILPPGQQAKTGLVLDLQVVVNDFDESTDPMPQTRVGWTFGCSPLVDPGLFGSLMLVADAAALNGVVPEFPPKPGQSRPPAEPPEYWREQTANLQLQPPKVYDGSQPPETLGGLKRLQALEAIESATARYPRVDYLELLQRIHRRMDREADGICARGLPRWWFDRLRAVSKEAEDPVPEGAARLFRLPMGGWLVRSSTRNFAIDPVGPHLGNLLWGGLEFCVLTTPLDMTRRNDQLLLGMLGAEPPRPVFTHIAFHLPAVPMDRIPLFAPGKTFGQGSGALVHLLGKVRDDGKVAYDCSYLVELAKGPRVLVMGMNLTVADAPEGPVDVVIASPRNLEVVAILAKAKPTVVLLDEAFACHTLPNVARVTLKDLHMLQKSLVPHHTVLLAPGESWLVQSGK